MSAEVTVRLPDELNEHLQDLATRTNRSRDFYVREALQAQLEDIADSYLAASLVQQVASGELGTGSWSALRSEFGVTEERDTDDLLGSVR